MKLSTDMSALSSIAGSFPEVEFRHLPSRSIGFVRACVGSDIVIVEHAGASLYLACLAGRFAGFHLVSVDPIVSRPSGFADGAKLALKRWLLRRVDCYVQFFRNVRSFANIIGADPTRFAYVPFKVNDFDATGGAPPESEGDFVLCAGRSRRDVATFIAALRTTGLPGVIVQQTPGTMAEHGTATITQDRLPANVRTVIDRGSEFATYLAAARLVVLPRFRDDINATGISTYLAAMALGKCVIISHGPGADDVLTDQAAFVEPEDPQSLATVISRLYHDAAERHRIAATGKHYADGLGGEERLLSDILRVSLTSHRSAADVIGKGRPAERDQALREHRPR